MKKNLNKGFKWSKWLKPNSVSVEKYFVLGGNFVMELMLPNALKLNTFTKVKLYVEEYKRSHSGHLPNHISISKKQYQQYSDLHLTPFGTVISCSFEGIPMYIRK